MGPFGRPWKGGRFTRDFERKVKFCFIRIPCQLGTLRYMKKKVPLTGISLHRGLVEELERVSFAMDFDRRTKDGSGNRTSLSTGAL
jgi:hypothetical protein